MKVRKYNNKLQDFDKSKIEVAITKSAEEAKAKGSTENIPDFMIKRIAQSVEDELVAKDTKVVSIQEISTMVENKLMDTQYKDTAYAYITYHYEKENAIARNSELIKNFKKKLYGLNIENSNANMDEGSFSGRMFEAGRVLYKDEALNMMSKISRDNHNNNLVYIHDLDNYAGGSHNCLSIPFDDTLRLGIKTRQTDIREAHSVNTAFQLIAVVMQIQSLMQFGGVAATHIDWTLVPYLRYSFFRHLKFAHKYQLDTVNKFAANVVARAVAEGWTDEEVEKLTKLLNVEKTAYKKFRSPKNIIATSIDDYRDDPCWEYAYDMTLREARQGAEGLIHNLNSLQSRSGSQLPFSSINYGTCTSTEGRIITDAILDAELSGTGPLHKTAIFPCCIFQFDRDINGYKGTPNYDLFRKSLECTAKRLYPNYANVNWSVDLKFRQKDIDTKKQYLEKMTPENMAKLVKWVSENKEEALNYRMEVKGDRVVINEKVIIPVEIMSTMGCRTYNGWDANFDFGYIIKTILKTGKAPENYFYSGNQKDGRGNICPNTIILPTVAMQAKGQLGAKNIDDFIAKLDKKIFEARDQLIERFTHIASQSPASAPFMYINNTMKGYIPEEGIISALKHGTTVIGHLGMAECLQILIGKDQTTEEGMELAKRIETLLNSRCAEFKAAEYEIKLTNGKVYKTHLNFGNYFTPAESLCHTACEKFKKKYGEIPNVSDKKFFTNSIHIPVWKDITPFEKIDLESQLTGFSNAGCITYVEMDSTASHNIDALEEFVVYAMEHDIPYLGLNLPNDTCQECGWTGEINDKCPACGSTEICRLRRVTGYLTNDYLTTFNAGKVDEVQHRVKHIGQIKGV